MDERTFELTLQTRRAELIDWLEALPAARRAEIAEQALAVGHQVLTYAQASATEEAAARFFRPVIDGMTTLNTNLETLMRYSEKSQRIGEIGEAIVAQQLQSAMPTDRFNLVSNEGHRADVDAWFNLGDGAETRAIVEVKLYTGPVPTTEIEKFRNDLRTQGVRYGLMVSLASRLTGFGGQFEIEANEHYLAVLVPEAGRDGVRLAWGAALLKALALHERRGGGRLDAEQIAQAWRRLQAHFGELEEAARQVGQFKRLLRESQAKLNATLDSLVDQAMAAEVRLSALTQQLAFRVQEELRELKTASGEPALPPPPDPDAVRAFLASLGEKDKRAPALRAIVEACAERDVGLALEGDKLVLVRGGKRLAETSGSGSRVDVSWSTAGEAEVRLRPGLEKLKDGAIVIEGKDVAAMVGRLEERLGGS
ncbi:MAG: hypothetical protein FJ102_09655 [Deltaproteobacteria bacterium]|nr:hypothetical protein [Deltaproteobacteria bacterium]